MLEKLPGQFGQAFYIACAQCSLLGDAFVAGDEFTFIDGYWVVPQRRNAVTDPTRPLLKE